MGYLLNLLPTHCALCGIPAAGAICGACREHYCAQVLPRCTQCALPVAQQEQCLCGACLKHPPAFDATVAATDYAPPTDQLVLAFKFGAQLAFAPLFSDMLHDATRQTRIELPDVLVPVPLGPKRLAERGFNQALEIAKLLSRALSIPLEKRLVLRTRETAAQALLPPDARRSNIRGAFTLSSRSVAALQGCHVGVVDDVMTTGETLNELAATLKRFGAKRATNLVFARTLK